MSCVMAQLSIDDRLRRCSDKIDAVASKFTLLADFGDLNSTKKGKALSCLKKLEDTIVELSKIPERSQNDEFDHAVESDLTDDESLLIPAKPSANVPKSSYTVPKINNNIPEKVDAAVDSDATDDLDFCDDDDESLLKKKNQTKDEPTSSTRPQSAAADITEEDWGSDATEDLESSLKQGALDENITGLDDFGDEDFDDDFDEQALQKIDEVEKSLVEDPAEEEEEDDPTQQPTEQKYLDVLKKYFGYGKFRPLQWKIINSVLNEKRDNLVIMATGYGKSLTYQFPSIFTGRTSIVVSPLISLMEDQVASLSTVNVKACFLGSAQQDQASVRRGVMRGEYRIVYMTPEFLAVATDFLEELKANVGIDLIAIDEAHCVSQWGHDFRSSYRQVGNVRKLLPKVPMMGLTATATPEVRSDISKSLSLKNPNMTVTSFDRPNLYLGVSMKSPNVATDLQKEMIKTAQNRYEFEGPTIIYCPTKKATENVHNVAKMLGVKSGLYHAGLNMSVRKKTHRDFINDDIQVVVATVAFGMGIDKPDVRKIIHYGAPKDIESYYQEIGRAGRDGHKSSCQVYYSTADFNTNRFLLQDIKSPKFLEHKQNMLQKMEQYFCTVKCRRRTILSHFESKDVTDVGGTDRCCDNCTRRKSAAQVEGGGGALEMDQERNLGREAKDLLDAIETTGNRYGLGMPVLFLLGSKSQKLPDYYHQRSNFGRGKYHNEKWWKAFARQLMTQNYLTEKHIQGSFGSTVEVSARGHSWLARARGSTEAELMMLPGVELRSAEERKAAPSVAPTFESKVLPSVPSNTWMSTREVLASGGGAGKETVNPRDKKLQVDLYRRLIALRNDLSHELGLAPHLVFSNKCLLDMSNSRPSSRETLISLEEVAEAKAAKYGDRFLQVINDFCKENSWERDSMPTPVKANVKMSRNYQNLFASLPETTSQSYEMFETQRMSLEETAFRRTLKTSTIITHLAKCITVGLPVDIERVGVTQKIQDIVTAAIRKPPINSDISRLTPIKDQVPDYIEFNHIKIVIAILQRLYGMNLDNEETSPTATTSGGSQGGMGKQFSYQGSTSSPRIPPVSRSSSVTTSRSSTDSPRSSSWQPGRASTTPSSQQSQETGKRKLPSWMMNKEEKSKKMKKNSLFSR